MAHLELYADSLRGIYRHVSGDASARRVPSDFTLAFVQLPDDSRHALLLRDDGRSVQEIAPLMLCTQARVRQTLADAVAVLRAQIAVSRALAMPVSTLQPVDDVRVAAPVAALKDRFRG